MELNTKLNQIKSYKKTITAFGGLNMTRTIRDAGDSSVCELVKGYNASSARYPALSVRGKRYIYIPDPTRLAYISSIEMNYNGGEFFICKRIPTGYTEASGSFGVYNGFTFWDTEDGITLEANSGKHSFANMGAYIVIMPEGVWFDTIKAKEYIEEEDEITEGTIEEHTVLLSDVFGKIEIEVQYASGAENACFVRPCFDDNTPASSYQTGHTFPESYNYSLADGIDNQIITTYNEDKTDINVYRYNKDTGKYLYQTDKILRFDKTGIGTGFRTGECIEIENVQISNNPQASPPSFYDLDFGTYGVITDCGANYLCIRFNSMNSDSYAKYCTRWTHGQYDSGNKNPPYCALTNFKIRRSLPSMKFITAWNNRLWGCGGDNNNTIYASALGDVRSWATFENTAADSYYANVGDGDEWYGAVTFDDHAYFFKKEKFWKLYGTRPANFTYKEYDYGTIDGKSICVVGEKMYFCSRDGIYVTNGGVPAKISDKLGNEDFSAPAVGYGYDGRYYIDSVRISTEKLYCYDTVKGIWSEESLYGSGIKRACALSDNTAVFCVDGAFSFAKTREHSVTESGNVPFEFVLSELSSYDLDCKYFSKIQISALVPVGAFLSVYIMSDGDGRWVNVKNIRSREGHSVLIPVTLRRCQRLQIKLSGEGNVEIYGVSVTMQGGSEYGKR